MLSREHMLADLERKGAEVFARGTPEILRRYWVSLPADELRDTWQRWSILARCPGLRLEPKKGYGELIW